MPPLSANPLFCAKVYDAQTLWLARALDSPPPKKPAGTTTHKHTPRLDWISALRPKKNGSSILLQPPRMARSPYYCLHQPTRPLRCSDILLPQHSPPSSLLLTLNLVTDERRAVDSVITHSWLVTQPSTATT